MSYDAVLLLSFGGPEEPNDIMPFLRNVTRGRNVPDERLAIVADQYKLLGGRSPINDQCRALRSAIAADLASAGIDLPVYWGNRNWHPFVADTVATMADDGIERALVFVTSAFGSYSGCRQYREDLASAAERVGDRSPELIKLRLFYNHPGFIEPFVDNLSEALEALPPTTDRGAVRVAFTAHSLPVSMAAGCDYADQLREAARLVIDGAGVGDLSWDVVYQSRSGPPSVPWLEPDVNDHLERLAAAGADHVIVVPIGFVSDHMEVRYDLDTQAAETADRLALGFTRVATPGVDPRFVSMVRQLVTERLDDAPRLALGTLGPWPDQCPPDHCPARRRRPAS